MPRVNVRGNLNTYTVTMPTTVGAATYRPTTVHYDEFATAFGPTPNRDWGDPFSLYTNTISEPEPEPERLPTIYEDGDLTVSFRAEEGEVEEAYCIQFGGLHGWIETIPTHKALGIARAIFEDIDKRYRGDHEGIVHTEDADTEAQDPPLHGLGDGERPEAGGSDTEIPW